MTLSMGIVKLEIKIPELVQAIESFRTNRLKAFEQISNEVTKSVTDFFNSLLLTEMDIFLGRPDQKLNKRNGFYEREFAIKNIGCIRLRVPRDRDKKFKSVIIPKGAQVDVRLKQDLAVLHLAGISNRTLALISKRLLGIQVSAQTVHNSLQIVKVKALEWLERPLKEDYWALFIDGTNFKIQRRGSTEREPTLVVLGLNSRNAFSILSLTPGQKDNVEAWGEVFDDLIKRGLKIEAVQIGVMDGLPGLESTFKKYFSKSVTARCWVHAKRNALMKASERLSAPFEELLNQVMYSRSEATARQSFANLKTKMGKDLERSVHCIEKDLDSLLVHYRFEEKLWRTLKTTNPIERVNKELKRRVKSMEGLGESTLNILLAFTAMRLEYNWQQTPVDSNKMFNLKQLKQRNEIEETLENLIH